MYIATGKGQNNSCGQFRYQIHKLANLGFLDVWLAQGVGDVSKFLTL